MTPLQQRFLDAIEESKEWTSDYEGTIWKVNDDKAAIACEKIAEEFAAEFAEWMISNLWKNKFGNEYISFKQFIQQFKEQWK